MLSVYLRVWCHFLLSPYYKAISSPVGTLRGQGPLLRGQRPQTPQLDIITSSDAAVYVGGDLSYSPHWGHQVLAAGG